MDPKITGEHDSKQLLFLICASARTRNPLSAIVKGPSGAGKSHLVNRVLDPFRKMGIVIEFSRITGAYLEDLPCQVSDSRLFSVSFELVLV